MEPWRTAALVVVLAVWGLSLAVRLAPPLRRRYAAYTSHAVIAGWVSILLIMLLLYAF